MLMLEARGVTALTLDPEEIRMMISEAYTEFLQFLELGCSRSPVKGLSIGIGRVGWNSIPKPVSIS